MLPSFIRKFHPGSTQLSLRFFATDQDINRFTTDHDINQLNEQQADVDPYCLVQKHLNAIADSIKKARCAAVSCY